MSVSTKDIRENLFIFISILFPRIIRAVRQPFSIDDQLSQEIEETKKPLAQNWVKIQVCGVYPPVIDKAILIYGSIIFQLEKIADICGAGPEQSK